MFRVIIEKSIKYLFICHSRRMTNVTAGQCLSEGIQNIRKHPICHKAVSGSAKSGCHLIKTSSTPYLSQSSLAFSKMKCRTSAFRQHPVKAVPPARSSTCHDTVQMLSPAPDLSRNVNHIRACTHTLSAQNGSPSSSPASIVLKVSPWYACSSARIIVRFSSPRFI